jgi:hypothetical protein
MVAGFIPPDHWTEVSGGLRKSGSVVLDASGKGVIEFAPSNGNQRWVITSVVVSTNQSSTASLVPYATGALNTTDISMLSPVNDFGATFDGNNDTLSGAKDVAPTDTFCVLFYAPPGQSGSSLAGVRASAVVRGTYYTRRA